MEHLKWVYLSWRGRICRQTYWIYSLPLAIIFAPLYVYDDLFNEFIYLLLVILICYPGMLINIKRAHDRNKSGWFCILLFIPIISLWPMVELGFIAGDEAENRFGVPDNTWNT